MFGNFWETGKTRPKTGFPVPYFAWLSYHIYNGNTMQYSVENLHLCPLPFLAVCRNFARPALFRPRTPPPGGRRSPDPASGAAQGGTVFFGVYTDLHGGCFCSHRTKVPKNRKIDG